MTQKIDPNYARSNNVVFEDGEWWYVSPATTGFKYRERLANHAKKNTTRMFVNGKVHSKVAPFA
jgi:hypothetical protein